MKNIFLLALFICNNASAQKELAYQFDTIKIENIIASGWYNGRMATFKNSQDSTYYLIIKSVSRGSEAQLMDSKKKRLIHFTGGFEYKTPEDLENLTQTMMFRNISLSKQERYNKWVEDFSYVVDSINNKIIVHLINYTNKRRKKIFNNHYYFFGTGSAYKKQTPISKYLTEKYKLEFAPGVELEKIQHLVDGKITSESRVIAIENVNVDFTFKINQIFGERKPN